MTRKLARLARKMWIANLEVVLNPSANVVMMMIACLVTSATRMDVRRIPSYAFQDTWMSESLVIFRFNAHHIVALSRYASVVVTRIALTTNNAIGRILHFPVF